jgi:SOS-response transcriptional repressor LexA
MLRGIKGTYIYVCDKNLREYFAEHIAKYKVEISVPLIPKENVLPYINSVPIYDLKAAAGNFSALQTVSDCDWVAIPSRYKPSADLFACTVIGESMNKVIPNGSICLFRKYSGGSRNGQIVLVERSNVQDPDSGSGYTVKEYRSKKKSDNDQWAHESIVLKPLTNSPGYSDIEILEDELGSLKVIGIFECVL